MRGLRGLRDLERGADALPEAPIFHRPLLDPGLLTPLKNAAADLGYGLL